MTEITGKEAGSCVSEASHSGNVSRQELIALSRSRERAIREYLNGLSRVPERKSSLLTDDPVRTKNLEKIAAQLQDILYFVARGSGEPPPEDRECLCCLLEQLENPKELSANNVWELADALEVMLVRLGDDNYVRQLIINEFPRGLATYLQKDSQQPESGGTGPMGLQALDISRARQFLVDLWQSKAQEYRRDRAKMRLRQRYLVIMTVVLKVFLMGFSAALVQAGVMGLAPLLMVLCAGAIGSVLSRALKLSRQPLGAENTLRPGDVPAQEPPLGIRALISGWTVFVAQPVIGATAALMLYLVFSSGLLQIGGFEQLSPVRVALLSFLAGYSEPFFTDILGKVAGKAGGSLG